MLNKKYPNKVTEDHYWNLNLVGFSSFLVFDELKARVLHHARSATSPRGAPNPGLYHEIMIDGGGRRRRWNGHEIPWLCGLSELTDEFIHISGISNEELDAVFPTRSVACFQDRHENYLRNRPDRPFPREIMLEQLQCYMLRLVAEQHIYCVYEVAGRAVLQPPSEFRAVRDAFFETPEGGGEPQERRGGALGPLDKVPEFNGLPDKCFFIFARDIEKLAGAKRQDARQARTRSTIAAAISDLERVHDRERTTRPTKEMAVSALVDLRGLSRTAAERCWEEAALDRWRKTGRRPKGGRMEEAEFRALLTKHDLESDG